MTKLKNPKVFWALWGAGAAAWQANSLRSHNGGTWSETTRALSRVETQAGKWLFLIGWGTLNAWFVVHILNKPFEEVMKISGS